MTAADTTVNTFNFKVHSTDGTLTHDTPVTLTVNADFHVPGSAVNCTAVTAGGTSTCSIDIGPDPPTTFASAVTYTCATAGFPNLSTCSFNPASIAAGGAATTVTLSVHTTAAVASLRPAGRSHFNGPLFAIWLSLPLMGIVGLGSQRRRRHGLTALGGALLAALLLFLMACGGGGGGGQQGQPGTNPGTYTFNVNAVSNGITHSAAMKLTVN